MKLSTWKILANHIEINFEIYIGKRYDSKNGSHLKSITSDEINFKQRRDILTQIRTSMDECLKMIQ